MADFKISIDTELQTNKIDSQINEIKSRLDNAFRNIPVTFDFNAAQNSVQNLARTATEGFQNINMTVNTTQVDDAIRRLNESAQQAFNNGGGGGNNLTQQTREAGEAAHEAADEYEQLGGTFAQNTEIFNTAVQVFQSLTEQVLQMNESMIEFQKVSDLQGADLDNYIDKLQGLGDTVARTGSEMLDSATEFRKNSFNDEDSARLAQVSNMFQNVADESMTAGESASFIIAQMKAFGIEADNAIHVVDSVNAVSNNFAVSSGDLAKNLGNMSSAMAVGNNTFEQSLGMLTSMTEITRSAAKGSRALVSVQSRYNQILDEQSSTGKALSQWYADHNIEIYDQNGELESLYNTLDKVAEIWPTLTDNEQKYFLNKQAGRFDIVPIQCELTGKRTMLVKRSNCAYSMVT